VEVNVGYHFKRYKVKRVTVK